MQMRFRLFVQQHHHGAFTVHVPAVPSVSAYAEARDAAIQDIHDQLVEHVRSLDRRAWSKLAFEERQELRALAFEVEPKGKGPQAPIPITVSILITDTQISRHASYLVITAPRIAGFHLVINHPEQLDDQARAALAHHMRKWTAAQVVEADMDGPESLATLTIEVPDAAEPAEELSNLHSQENVLGLCGLNVTEQAARGRLGRADRREALVEQVVATLAADRLNSVILVGAADVGKTAILHEVVERIRQGNVPATLRGREVWFATANNLIAGMKYTGEWQGRTQKLIGQVRKGRQILYMADPNEILDAGRWSGSDNNMGRFLRPYMESGEVTIICECAQEGFDAGLRVEPSFMNAFRRIDVRETDEADTLAIVHATARRLESARNVSIDPAATAAALNLTRRFMPYRAFPGKAVRFLEELVRDALPGQERSPALRTLSRNDALQSFTRATGLPAFILSDELAMQSPEVRAYFEERLLGQPDAVEAMVDLITVIKASLNDPQKPLGSFFFVGPTGVGKTEAAKVLAEFLFGSRERMIRFDMSEYAAADALPLGVLGEGRLTDASGRTADFRNAIIIMTSNLGASRREMQAIGFGAQADGAENDQRLRAHFTKEAEQFFRPEFFNRIDRIVAFRPLTLDAMRLITRRELGKLLMREGVVRRNLLVEIDDAVIERLLAQGFHPLYGARPLQREIERMVILPLARLVVERRAGSGHLLRFGVRDGQIHLSLVPLDIPEEAAETTPAASAPDRRLAADLQVVLRAIRELRERAADEAAGPVVKGLRREVSALLRRTNEPTFWDAPADAREVLSRVYHLESVLKRFDDLYERAEYLDEKGRQIRMRRDRRGVPELARDVERLEAEFAYVRMELAGASAGAGHDQALLRITPLGRDSDAWAARLLAMYTAWAARKGYEYTVLDPSNPPESERRNPDGWRGKHHLVAPALYVKGSNVYEFLRGESGLHKLISGPAEDRQRDLARVAVLPARNLPDGDDPTQLYAALTRQALSGTADPSSHADSEGDESGAVARVYSQGRHRTVRDPRTGARSTDVHAVLHDGQIDVFLLAALRQHATRQTSAQERLL